MNEDQKRVQTEVELALAEVARLKTVALKMEEDNKSKRAGFEAEIALLVARIPALENDIDIRKETLTRLKKQTDETQELVNDSQANLALVKENLSDTEKSLADRMVELKTLETNIKNETSRFDTLVTEKNSELALVKKAIFDAESLHDSNISKHDILSVEAEKKLIDVQSSLLTAKEQLTITTRETGTLTNQAQILKNQITTLESDAEFLTSEIEDLKNERVVILASVEPLRKEMADEQAQLKALIKERIQQHESNRAVIAKLDQREETLRERYEEVGLEYK